MNRAVLTVVLLSPIVMVGAVMWGIARLRPEMNAPPVGAGAGSTGGANAIGEYLAHGSAKRREVPPAGPDQPDPAPNLVAPESLEQGFVLVVTDESGSAGRASPIFLACNLNGWNPADPVWKLAPQSDGRWSIAVAQPKDGQSFEFKFTRGSWGLEELDAGLNVIANRALAKIDASRLAPGERPRIALSVPHWGDQRPGGAAKNSADAYRHIDVTGTLRRVQVQGGAGGAAGHVRDLLVWLPPGYDDPANAAVSYPVLYLHDGQNLFEKTGAIPAEWRVDETASELIAKGSMQPIIIVGIPHSGAGRMSEYLPVPALGSVPPQGELHVQWLISEVLPRIQRAFRVKTGPEHTGIGGSSLGAAISLYAAGEHPEVFGLLLAESLPLRTGNAEAWDQMTQAIKAWPSRVYLGIGGQELGSGEAERNKSYVDAVRALDTRLEEAGLESPRRLLVVDPAASHNEQAWAARLPRALTFLFPGRVPAKE